MTIFDPNLKILNIYKNKIIGDNEDIKTEGDSPMG